MGSQNKKRGGAPLGSPETYRRTIHPHHATTGRHPATLKIHKLTKHKALMIYDSKKRKRKRREEGKKRECAVGSPPKKRGGGAPLGSPESTDVTTQTTTPQRAAHHSNKPRPSVREKDATRSWSALKWSIYAHTLVAGQFSLATAFHLR